jgi:hypothetical protein
LTGPSLQGRECRCDSECVTASGCSNGVVEE